MTKDDFYSSINSDMKLTKGFFLKIYGYELSYPGFAEIALGKLEELGCTKAKDYYTGIVGEYEQEHNKAMKNVAAWYRKQDFQSKKGDEINLHRRQRERTRFTGFPEDW